MFLHLQNFYAVYFVVISCLLNIAMCACNWLFYYLYDRSAKQWKEEFLSRFKYGTIVMSIISLASALIGLTMQTYPHSDNCGVGMPN